MGYETWHKINKIIPEDDIDHEENINQKYNEIFEEWTRWYSFEADMIDYSTNYPETLFEIYTEGEDQGDIIIYYFKNGKMQKCEAIVTFPEFNESKLQ